MQFVHGLISFKIARRRLMIASTRECDGNRQQFEKGYERSGNTFTKVSDWDQIAKEHALSKIHLARKPVSHCPGWLALDESVNALVSHVYAVAVQQLGGLQKARRAMRIRLVTRSWSNTPRSSA